LSEGKYTQIGGVIKQITSEYTQIGGVIKQVTINATNIGGAIKQISVGEKYIWACEQESDRLYGIDDAYTNLAGWPLYGGTISDPVDVACDGDYSYWACDDYVYKFALDGTEVWKYQHPYPVLAVCVDADGYVYTGDFHGDVRKFDPSLGSGFELLWWKVIAVGPCKAVAVDYSAGKLYATFEYGLGGRVYWFHTSNGNNLPAYTVGLTQGYIIAVAVDESGILYVGTSNGYLIKVSNGGYVYWSHNVGGEVYAVRIGHGGYGYYVNGSVGYVVKFARADGAAQWTDMPSGISYSVAVDSFGNVYSTHGAYGSANAVIRKNNSSGVEQWTWQPYVNSRWRGIAVSPGIKAAGL